MNKYIELHSELKPINGQNFAIGDVNDLRGGYFGWCSCWNAYGATIRLPSMSTVGKFFFIKRCKSSVTINGNGHKLMANTSFVDTLGLGEGQTAFVIFDGDQWHINRISW